MCLGGYLVEKYAFSGKFRSAGMISSGNCKYIPMFRGQMLSLYSQPNSRSTLPTFSCVETPLELPQLEERGRIILRNGKYLPVDTVQHPTKYESS